MLIRLGGIFIQWEHLVDPPPPSSVGPIFEAGKLAFKESSLVLSLYDEHCTGLGGDGILNYTLLDSCIVCGLCMLLEDPLNAFSGEPGVSCCGTT